MLADLPLEFIVPLISGVFVIALLYSTVGHAGASGYIAVMAVVGVSPLVIKPTALSLNILVATLAFWQFRRAGYFHWRLFWRFALPAVPLAFVGGYLQLPVRAFHMVVGLVLLYSALRFFLPRQREREPRPPSTPVSLGVGGLLGFLSGLVGVGGGIFLTPLMILLGWARTKTAAAVSALFILVNSVAGLAGNLAGTKEIPLLAVPLAGIALTGGLIGSYLGSRRLPVAAIQRLLAVVLLFASAKLLLM
jgi:uncharacterized membrane protein YfcA